jgi:hypothetical protein
MGGMACVAEPDTAGIFGAPNSHFEPTKRFDHSIMFVSLRLRAFA